jgi:AcrR family transcriptional regulator
MSTATTQPAAHKAATTAEKVSARDRLLNAADALFYEQGIHTVGVDTIIERAGVAKATLYSTFGSKDELIRAYLNARHEDRVVRVERRLARFDTPREKLVGFFATLENTFAQPTYRGCAFINASAESPPGSIVEQVADVSRGWVRTRFADLATEAGVADPQALAASLVMVYDGAIVSARMDRHPKAAADTALAIATALIDAAVPSNAALHG